MGAISVEKEDHLYWLGRYIERIFTTMEQFYTVYDKMLDSTKGDAVYPEYCRRLSIPNIYESKEHFITSYLFSKENPDSFACNIEHAYDNGIVLREIIGTEALSYIQIVIDTLARAIDTVSPLFALQPIRDNIYAFWGCIDDSVGEEECRNIMKFGRRMERLDLYLRFHFHQDSIEREFSKLIHRLALISVEYDEQHLWDLREYVMHGVPEQGSYKEAVLCLEELTSI